MRFPAEVEKVFGILHENGCAAWAVGGCVRDFLLGRQPKDYDVSTDALPEAVIELFSGYTVVPTGLQHGTVTIVIGGMPVEVTTFRTDGAYLDNRRPSTVTFTTNIKKDLARRDFTVNAIAWNPWDGFVDCFAGRNDLEECLIRCVGDPDERFGEDALRILRALRLASELGFTIEENTAKSLHKCRELLKNISAERINAEFSRLLLSGRAAEYLVLYCDVMSVFIPGLKKDAPLEQRARLMDKAGDLCARLAILLDGLYNERQAREWLCTMKYDNCTARDTLTLLKYKNHAVKPDKLAIRLWLKTLGVSAFLRLLDCRGLAENMDEQKRIAQEILASGECYSLKDLAVNGRDIIELGMHEGSAVGAVLNRLLMEVIREKAPNQKGVLLTYAKNWMGERV